MCELDATSQLEAAQVIDYIERFPAYYGVATVGLMATADSGYLEYLKAQFDPGSSFRLGLTGNAYTESFDFWEPITMHASSPSFSLFFLHAFLKSAIVEVDHGIERVRGLKPNSHITLLHKLRNSIAHDGLLRLSKADIALPLQIGHWVATAERNGQPALYDEHRPGGTQGMMPGDVLHLLQAVRDHLTVELRKVVPPEPGR